MNKNNAGATITLIIAVVIGLAILLVLAAQMQHEPTVVTHNNERSE